MGAGSTETKEKKWDLGTLKCQYDLGAPIIAKLGPEKFHTLPKGASLTVYVLLLIESIISTCVHQCTFVTYHKINYVLDYQDSHYVGTFDQGVVFINTTDTINNILE